MTQAEFARQVEQLQGTLYRIAATCPSYAIGRTPCSRPS